MSFKTVAQSCVGVFLVHSYHFFQVVHKAKNAAGTEDNHKLCLCGTWFNLHCGFTRIVHFPLCSVGGLVNRQVQ